MRSVYRTRGFTLIELLVVIAIIAVLAAILFPVFAKAREKAWQSTCISNQRQLAAGLAIYVQDNDETFFPADNNVWSTKLSGLPAEVFHCPSTSDPGSASTPNYGFNAALYGVALGKLVNPSMCPLTADYSALNARTSYQIADWNNDIDPRHSNKDTVILSCVDGHVAAELVFNPAIPTGTFGALLMKGYNPYDGATLALDQPAQISSWQNANGYSITPNGGSPTIYTIPDGACYENGSAPNIIYSADLAVSQVWNYADAMLGAYLAAPVTNASYTGGIFLALARSEGGFAITQNATCYSDPGSFSATIAYSLGNATSTSTEHTYSNGNFYRLTAYIINGQATLVAYNYKTGGVPMPVGCGVSKINWSLLQNQTSMALFSHTNGGQTAYAQNIKIYIVPPITQ